MAETSRLCNHWLVTIWKYACGSKSRFDWRPHHCCRLFGMNRLRPSQRRHPGFCLPCRAVPTILMLAVLIRRDTVSQAASLEWLACQRLILPMTTKYQLPANRHPSLDHRMLKCHGYFPISFCFSTSFFTGYYDAEMVCITPSRIITSSLYSECTICRQRGMRAVKLLQQNSAVLNWECWLTDKRLTFIMTIKWFVCMIIGYYYKMLFLR